LTGPQTVLALCRLTFYSASITVYGACGFMAWVAPKPLGREIAATTIPLMAAASILALLSTLAWMPTEAATIGESWLSALDSGTLSALLFETATGKAWLVRLSLSVLLVATLLRLSAVAERAALSALLLASLAFTGHANMDDGALGSFHIANHALHLLAGGAWLGSLIVLPACLARLRDPAFCVQAKTALQRFSLAGHLAVALVIGTGIVNTILVLQRWPTDFTSTYQILLDAKIVLVIGMTGLALLNRYAFVPRMRTQRECAVAQIRTGTFAELALGASVLALVAVFGILDPA
jgi:putative copper resistance protein D